MAGGPDVSQNQALELANVLDALPAGEVTTMLDGLQMMGLPWKKLAAAIERVAAWSPLQRRRQ